MRHNHDIYRLIDRYFDGRTTLDEERLLRRLLADPAYDSPEADEARAVLGYLAAGTPSMRPVRRRYAGMLRAAVMTGVIAAVGVSLFFIPRQDTYVAYVDGIPVRDRNVVEQRVGLELAAISEAAMYVDMQTRQQAAEVAEIFSTVDFNETMQ